MSKKLVFFLALVFAVGLSNSANSAVVDWKVVFKGVKKQLDKAYQDIHAVQDIVGHIDRGEPVPAKNDSWKDLANNYSTVSKQLASMPLPTDFDKAAYTVSLSELTSCATRPASIQKLKDLTAKIKSETSSGTENLATVDAALEQLKASRTVITYLKTASLKLASVPIFGKTFLWNWVDLEFSVSKSLSEATTVLEQHRKKLAANLDLATTQSGNLESNTKLLEGAICEISGRWAGDCVTAKSGKVSKLIIDATKINGAYVCQFTRPGGATYACRDFTFDEANAGVSFKAQQAGQPTTINWTGRMNQNASNMRLQYAVGSAQGTCSLNR